ncbi:LLM class F420-dependent oxidoreductase [Winogradskya humida]|uniref:LLM class F420-dependent oxidoreductase n=1 Tax=Winogradskya humida TaxID=113566 RepID=A0ABQ4A118_9ACTN|nr:LLM class F420-dependent oxidoreductase [Actinoplanes humidus]GIE24541.1 LLM class F420-dependent oxidoreductase [Actinoplanes humidus]
MKIGLHIRDYSFPGGTAAVAATLARIARHADQAGFAYIAVPDHVFQVSSVGPAELDMLEAYTTLGFLAGHTEKARLLTLVTAVTFRDPGMLAKIVSTLDVLSGGRAMLGIGAGWNREETAGLGLHFPEVAARFEHLEDALRLCARMWAEDESPFEGIHVRAERPLSRPRTLTRPHPPVLIGGEGEQKTLRLVAKYAQASNFFWTDRLPGKLAVLREHCEREGRDYAEIEKTVYYEFDPGPDGERAGAILDDLARIADAGLDTVIGPVTGAHTGTPLDVMGERIIPVAGKL